MADKTEYEKEVNKLARLQLTNAEAYEKFANELLAKHGTSYKGLAEAGEMVEKAKAEYEEIKSSCEGNRQKIAEKVNEIRRRDYFKGSLLMDCGIVAGDLRNVREEKPKTQSKQSVTAHKEKSANEIYSEIRKMEKEKRIEALAKLRNENKKMYDEVYRIDNTGGYVSFPWKEATEQAEKIVARENAAKVKIYQEADKLLKGWNDEVMRSGMSIRLQDIKQNNPNLYEAICNQVTLDDYFKTGHYKDEVKTNLKAFQQESNAGQENAGQVKEDKAGKEGNAGGAGSKESNAGKEGQAGSGRSGGTGSRAGGNSTRTTGNMTISADMEYALKMGPTVLKEKMKEMGIKFDEGMIRHAANGNEYIPTSKLRKFMQEHEFTPEQIDELNALVNDKTAFNARVDKINERDQYPSSRSATGNGSRAAGEKPSLEDGGVEIEFKDKGKAEPKLTREQAAESNTPILADMNVLKNLPTAEKMRIIASSSIPVPEGLSIDDQLALVVKAELDKTKGKDEKPKEEKPKELTPEEKARLEQFEQYKKICKENPNLYDNMKLNAKNAGFTANVKFMEDVEKYVKLEKQMQKDAKKAAKLSEKIQEAERKGKEEKAAKLKEKKADIDKEIANKEKKMDALESGKDIKAAMKTDTKAAEAQSSEGKKGNIFQRAGKAISNTASNVGNAVSNTASGIVNKVAKKKVELTVDGDKTTYKLSGFEGKNLEDSSKLCNGIYTYDKASDKIYYQEKEGVEPTRFDFEDEKDCTEYLRALGNAYSSYGKSAPTQIKQQGNER